MGGYFSRIDSVNHIRRIGLFPLLAGVALTALMAFPASAIPSVNWQAKIYYSTGPGMPLSVLYIGHWTQSGCQQVLQNNVLGYLPSQGYTVVSYTQCSQISVGTPLPNVERTD
jgi:hypothetical protein